MIPEDAQLAEVLFKLVALIETRMGLLPGEAIAVPDAWYFHGERYNVRVVQVTEHGSFTQVTPLGPFTQQRVTTSHQQVSLRVIPFVPAKNAKARLRLTSRVGCAISPYAKAGWTLTNPIEVRAEADFPRVLEALGVSERRRADARSYRRQQSST
jgi:hypothetical protein